MAEKTGFLQKVKSWARPLLEGSYRGPALGQGELGGWYEVPIGDGFQRNLTMGSNARHVAPVYSVVMLNARAVSQCEPKHLVPDGKGGLKKSTTTPAARILRAPNEYETWTQLIFNTTAEMLFEGESLWVATRDDRFAIQSVHRLPRGSWSVEVDPETKSVFYAVGGDINPAAPEFDMMVPARDVVHFRQHTPRHPLLGESPLKAAAMAIGINVSLNQSQLAFFNNFSRPSGVISTDQTLNQEQIIRLREAWENASTALAQGKVPVLLNGLKFQPMSIPQNDQQLIEQQRMSIHDIARVYGVPVALLSEQTGPQGATESLINSWLSIGLGSIIETIERSLERLFGLKADERIELDPRPLLRVDFQARVDGLARAVTAGIMSPDEARLSEGLGRIGGGDQVYMQQQMIGLDMLGELHRTAIEERLNRSAEPEAPEPEEDEEEEVDSETVRALVIQMRDYKRKAANGR